ncbi:MAG: ATP-binding protein [Candidatus Omnitrophica bacterium]|nr:ATP-binding protein [Candidatus Omnitrophota bacterium]
MISKDIDKVTEADLQSLIDNAVSEGKEIEYKQSLQISSDGDRKEFLADVSSFANASGGDLIIGISQKDGNPEALFGIDISDKDAEIRKLDGIIRDGIEPRIPSVVIQPIKLANSKVVLVIRIAKSWLSPHRVTLRGYDKFYSRSTNGKYPLDVSELRVAFSLSEAFADRIRRFREDRISKIYADEMFMPFNGNSKMVLHLIPFASFKPGEKYEIEKIASQPRMLPPIYCSGWNSKYNLDGFLTYSGSATEKSHTYTQLYRNGIIEAVNGSLIREHDKGQLFIPSIAFEKELIASLKTYLKLMKDMKIELPIILFLTLVNVKGYSMYVDPWKMNFFHPPAIDREILLLPEVIIENYDIEAEQILKPCFDAVWNACGFPKSRNYDENGKWVER